MKATLLGTSGAWPIPRPGCTCPQCAQARAEPRLRRSRSALRLEADGEVLVFDPGPDILAQLEREGFGTQVDRILISHTHEDHVLGLDDLVHMRKPWTDRLPVHAAPAHQERIVQLFPRLVREGRDWIRFEDWSPGTRIEWQDVVLEGFETGHRKAFPTTGLLLEMGEGASVRRIALATDMGDLPAASRERLGGVDLFVGDGSVLGEARRGHPGTDTVLEVAAAILAKRLAFTHIGHVRVTDAELRQRLGVNAGLAYDGDDLLRV